MAFERGSELERVHKLRMVWIARSKKAMGALERPRAKTVAGGPGGPGVGGVDVGKEVGGGTCGKRCGKRHNLVNEGSGDYALQVASNSEETGIRVGPRRTI